MAIFDINDYVTMGGNSVYIITGITGGYGIKYEIKNIETGYETYAYEHQLHRNIGRQRKYNVLGYQGTSIDVINFEKRTGLKVS